MRFLSDVGMALPNFRMFIHELLRKDPYIVPERAPLIVLDIKSAMRIANNGKDAKHTRQISSRIHFVSNRKNARCARYIGVK